MAVRVAIIGAGYAGMAAAVTLTAQGIPVTVFEAAQVLGGRARRVEVHDTALDNGLHILLGAYRQTLRLIRQVNPDHELALWRSPLRWCVQGQLGLKAWPLPAPLHLLGGLLSARGLQWRQRLSALRMVARLQLRGYRMDEDISVDALLDRHQQDERLRELLWRPLCVAALNTPSNIASAAVFLSVLRDSLGAARGDSDIVISRVDLTSLFPEPAAAWITRRGSEVVPRQRVTSIAHNGRAFRVEFAGGSEYCSHVICAVPAHRVPALLGNLRGMRGSIAIIEQLRYQPIYSVWLKYPRPVELPSPMMGLTGGLVHWVFDRGYLCGQQGILGAVISARGDHERLTLRELATRVHQELCCVASPLPEPEWSQVIAEKRATFECAAGVRRPSQITALDNLLLAGDYTRSDYPATLESAVRSGISCAEQIATRLRTRSGQ